MALRSRQKLWHKIAFSWITIIFLLLFTILLFRGVFGMYEKNAQAGMRAQDANIELAKVEERKKVLTKNLEHIKTSKGVEEELRKKFDVAKGGEHLLVIVDKEVEPEQAAKQDSWFTELWHKLTD